MNAEELVAGFVEGTVSSTSFQQALFERDDVEELLAGWDAPPEYVRPLDAFHYLLELDLQSPSGDLNARGLLEDFLRSGGVTFDHGASEATTSRYEALLAAQPRWLDLDDNYLASILAELGDLNGPALTSAMRNIIANRFRSVEAPPQWLQSPAWPIVRGTPAVFIGQLQTMGHHDEAFVYVFLDEPSGEHFTVVQMA